MDIKIILDILSGNSKDLKLLQKNVGYVRDFVSLTETLDAHPQIKSRIQEENRNFYSLYKAVGEGIAPQQLEKHLIGFFGAPVKRPGEAPSFKLRFYPSLKLMGKIMPEQTFFIRKIKNAEFFAAIWPWVRKPGFLTLHMGYYSKTLSDEDFLKLEDVVKTNTHQKIAKEMESGPGGQLRGINLPTFLQMSEQESATCALAISCKDKSGRLYLEEGQLVDGETGNLKGKDAVFEIIKWDNVVIEIETNSLKRPNIVNTPLLNILLEGLKQKDEEQVAAAAAMATAPEAQPQAEAHTPPKPEAGTGYDQVNPPKEADDLVLYDDLNKTPILKYVIILLVMAGIIGGGVWGAQFWLKSRYIKKEYDVTIQLFDNSNNIEEKEALLNNFISKHANSFYAVTVKRRLRELKEHQDDQLFEAVSEKVAQLPITNDYDVKAKQLYNEYLKKYPSGKNAGAVRKLIADLPDMVEESQYKHLVSRVWTSKEEKIEAHQKYLENHPKGKHKEEVELFLVLEIEQRYEAIQKQLKTCEEKNEWSPCTASCSQFLKYFDNTYRTDEIRNIKNTIEVKQHLAQLSRLAERLEPNHKAIKKLYEDYLSQNPKFLGKKTIQDEIRKRQALINEAEAWNAVVAFSDNPNKSFIEKIQELDQYIDKSPNGPYAEKARELRDKIRKARLNHDLKLREAAQKSQKEAVLRAEIMQKQRETNRLNQETLNLQKKLYNYQNIFEYNNDGTFKDKRTGLTWCILDSSVVLGKCLDYEDALQYVGSLNTGGHTDWRLPTFSELASLYKNDPFFPADGLKWFWTIERVVKGYHEMVGIVSSAPEKVFNREYVSTKKCATVHAVRR